MALEFGKPHELRRHMLASKDADTWVGLTREPSHDSELRLSRPAVRQGDVAAEVQWIGSIDAGAPQFVRERPGIVGPQGYSFQSLVVHEPCTASRIVRSFGHDTDQLDVIRIKHYSEICSTQVRAVNPSRSERET